LSEKTYPGDTYTETLEFKNKAGAYFDPATVAVEFYTPGGVLSGSALAIGDLTRTSEGIYELEWTVPSAGTSGTWARKVTATSSAGEVQSDVEPFTVSPLLYGPSASAVPYCTSEVVKSFSQVQYKQLGLSDDSALDTLLENYVLPAAQKIIDNYVGHNFQNNSGTVKLDGNGKEVIMIPPPYLPTLSLTSVTVDDVNVTSSIKRYPTYLALDGGNFTETNSDHQNVEVVLSYGYAAVPEDIGFACAEVAARQLTELVRRKLAPDVIARMMMKDDDMANLSSVGRFSRILSPEIKEVLDKYRYSTMDVT
jgi:hypothetical protein